MKVLLINPPRVKGFPVVREERFEHKDIGSVYPPLSLLMAAGLLERERYEVSLIDANGFNLTLADVRKKINDFHPDITIIRLGFDTQKEDLKVVKLAKVAGATTIIRNHIIARTPWLKEKLLKENPFVDIFLNCEPEGVIANLISVLIRKGNLNKVAGISFRSGQKIINTQKASLNYNLDKLPYPTYHLLPSLSVYYSGTFGPPFVTVLGSRGCPFNCAFCAYSRQLYRTRSSRSIADEIEWLVKKYQIHDFCFLDDVMAIDPARAIEIAKAIIAKKLQLRWSIGIRATSVTKEALIWLKKAGCDEIAVGVESGSDKILKTVNKGVTVADIRHAADLCHKVGIKFYAMFIIGLPGETDKTVDQSIKLAKELKAFYTQFCFATPFPDTRIYQYYLKNKLLLTKDWSKYFPLNSEPVIRTQALSKKDLIRLRNRAYRETLFNPGYLLRQVKLSDWSWNIRGVKELGKRMLAAFDLQPVR